MGLTSKLGHPTVKTEVPEFTQTSVNQPQPDDISTSNPTSTITNNNNDKHAPTNEHQTATPQHLPCKVSLYYHQQEQKQLQKRGQPLSTGTLITMRPETDIGKAGARCLSQPSADGHHHFSKTQTPAGG